MEYIHTDSSTHCYVANPTVLYTPLYLLTHCFLCTSELIPCSKKSDLKETQNRNKIGEIT